MKMSPKRKPFIWLSGFCAFALFILAAAVLGVALNNALSKIRRLVIVIVEPWQVTLGKMIFLGIFSAMLALFTLWSVLRARKKSKILAFVVILGHCIALGGAIYVVLVIDKLHAAPSKSRTEMLKLVNQQVQDGRQIHKNKQFVPPWMDSIQKNDAHCCGVETYRDWETFWSPQEKTFPKSCCRSSKSNCTTSVRDIVYPDLLANNIKTEGGCYALIVSTVKAIILESKKFCSILTVGIGVSLAAVAVLYVVVFFLKKSPGPGQGDDYDSDDDDDRFPQGDVTWRNLEFYRVLLKRKPKKDKALPTSGSYTVDSSTFQPSGQMDSQVPQASVQYRVDVLSPNTVQVPATSQASSDPAPPAQGQTTITVAQVAVTVDSVTDTAAMPTAVFSTNIEDDVQDQIRRNAEPQPRKRLHRHRHRRDYQENEVNEVNSGGSPI